MIFLFFIIVLLVILFYKREKLSTQVYTFTPTERRVDYSDIAQFWWQPVAYILNPLMGWI